MIQGYKRGECQGDYGYPTSWGCSVTPPWAYRSVSPGETPGGRGEVTEKGGGADGDHRHGHNMLGDTTMPSFRVGLPGEGRPRSCSRTSDEVPAPDRLHRFQPTTPSPTIHHPRPPRSSTEPTSPVGGRRDRGRPSHVSPELLRTGPVWHKRDRTSRCSDRGPSFLFVNPRPALRPSFLPVSRGSCSKSGGPV